MASEQKPYVAPDVDAVRNAKSVPTAERDRSMAETQRVAAESMREAGEHRRQSAETARTAAEDERVTTEAIRQDAMSTVRATAESLHEALRRMEALEGLRRALRDSDAALPDRS